jgi:hypothetical protein
MIPGLRRLAGVSALAIVFCAPAAAVTPPVEDLHYLAEHLAEAAQDARYFALPWPTRGERDWRPVVAVGGARFESEVAKARGGLLTLGAARAAGERWRYALLAFYDRFDVTGGSTDFVLTAGSTNVPLDLPAQAEIQSPSGEFVHDGIGLVLRREPENRVRGWAFVVGVLVERLTLKDYRFRYRLLSGVNEGDTGFVDYSSSNTYLSPFVGAQRDIALGADWTIGLRGALGIPLPAGEFKARVTGPGFDVTTDSPGSSPGRIGDGYVMLGAGLRERRTGLELDVGALLAYGPVERLTHDGVRRGLLFSVTWRGD